MSSGEKLFTTAGNMRAPGKLLCLEWVKKAWATVSSELIIKSFKTCSISVTTDGSEDDNIHCFKAGQVAANAAANITVKTTKLNNGEEVENEDDNSFTSYYGEDKTTTEDKWI